MIIGFVEFGQGFFYNGTSWYEDDNGRIIHTAVFKQGLKNAKRFDDVEEVKRVLKKLPKHKKYEVYQQRAKENEKMISFPMIVCTKCKKEKVMEDFFKDDDEETLYKTCVTCRNKNKVWNRKWWHNREKEKLNAIHTH